MSASFSSSIAPVAQVAQVAQVASWLWSRRACVAGGVTALATANYLRKHASATHSHQQQHPVATTAGDADASSVQRVCPPAVVSVDKSLFPSLIASPSVPGVTLFTRCWRVSGTPRALVFLLHGYGEHSGRYESLAACLNSLGVSVYALDHVGHGQSGGDRAYVERLHHYVHDALTFIEGVQKSEEFAKNQPPAFLFGHSMGGLIASLAMQSSFTPPSSSSASAASSSPSASSSSSSASSAASSSSSASGPSSPSAPVGLPQFPLAALQQYWRGRLWPWRGCVLSSPALAPTPADAKPALITLALFLSRHFPKLQLTGLDVSGLSRCAAVVAHYRSDRLVWHGRMRARWAVEMMSGMACVGEELRGGRVQFPMLVLQGTDDRLVHAPGATLMHDLSVAQDKTMRIFEGGYHELLNDPVTQQQAMQDISEWITARMATRP